ncbi:aminotransferase class IV [Paenibacillus sp. MMS18-CY102]|uniref:aminotransferase class IV n=1 Tax=Paenibacillus sp. MMS18-CY102 TaxID=2682849 RepID=UPI0013661EFF|nr:aminotransferase class IV [Paenibacillus sp. MMS18-CY102]MWC27604.1 hypothetical protein [Paenibacillus sp. MMS18-CY102]
MQEISESRVNNFENSPIEENSFELMESMYLSDGEIPLLPLHMVRLKESSNSLSYNYDYDRIIGEVKRNLDNLLSGNYKFRVTLSKAGIPTITYEKLDGTRPFAKEEIPPDAKICTFCFAAGPVDSSNLFLYHKSTNRRLYELIYEERNENDDVLMYNEKNEITEFTRGNIVIELDSQLVTPPYECGLIPGVLRSQLLNSGVLQEKKLSFTDVKRASRVWLLNSVGGWHKFKINTSLL